MGVSPKPGRGLGTKQARSQEIRVRSGPATPSPKPARVRLGASPKPGYDALKTRFLHFINVMLWSNSKPFKRLTHARLAAQGAMPDANNARHAGICGGQAAKGVTARPVSPTTSQTRSAMAGPDDRRQSDRFTSLGSACTSPSFAT